MTMYAKITLNPLQDTGERSVSVVPDPNPGANKPIWVPFVNTVEDTSTPGSSAVSSREKRVFSDRVEMVTIRRDKTPNEIALDDDRDIENLFENAGNDRALINLIRDLDNRVRILEGQPPLPLQTFKALVKSKRRN